MKLNVKEIVKENVVIDYLILNEESNVWELSEIFVKNNNELGKYFEKFAQLFKNISMKAKRDLIDDKDIKELKYSMVILQKIVDNIGK